MKIGDTVQVNNRLVGWGSARTVGETGRVVNIDADSVLVQPAGGGPTYWAVKQYLDVVDPLHPVEAARKLLEDAGYKVKAIEVHKDVDWRPGDVVDYRYRTDGLWYTYVRTGNGWSGNNRITDAIMNDALVKGHANPVLQADEKDNGRSVPFDTARLV